MGIFLIDTYSSVLIPFLTVYVLPKSLLFKKNISRYLFSSLYICNLDSSGTFSCYNFPFSYFSFNGEMVFTKSTC